MKDHKNNRNYIFLRGGGYMAKRQNKVLTVEFTGTQRKAREFEKDLRTFVTSYLDRAGVDSVTVDETNKWLKKKLG